MTTLVFSHPACLEHDTGPNHPESPDRLRALLDRLSEPGFRALAWREAPRAARHQLARVHGYKYISDLLAAMQDAGWVDYDATGTRISERSEEAALRAAGAVCAAVDAVAAGEAKNAFCAVRPPGHHAEPARTMGFCLFNNVAIGACHAREIHGYRRIAVIDFDVHHGNGTQTMTRGADGFFFASTHQMFLFPHGQSANDGDDGNVINVGLVRGCGGAEYRRVFRKRIVPRLAGFKPEFILISAGFDAHHDDPLGDLRLNDADFEWVTREIAEVADRDCDGRLVSVLEGGYDPQAVAAAGVAHVRALMAA